MTIKLTRWNVFMRVLNITKIIMQQLKTKFVRVADINTNPDNPVIGTRSFGADQ
jgi:beta-glucosidase-like glycosyl hydrolase